eukprot:maker-scaffold825_size91437-snap-gene-0.16 protein:Tk05920 transcript:maker-scaffold825_size91437-snap-gene-0.16-mRNA-1 annotation:"gamma-1-syntrophin isoform x2"
MASTLVRKQFHYGIVNVSDGKCRPQTARLKVCPEYLVLQREEFIFPDDDDSYPMDNKKRTLRLKRQPDGSLGISIKGGTDHNLPILISKVCRLEPEEDHPFIGDAITKVNHTSLSHVTHDEAINILRNAGPEVVLSVRHFRTAAPFLLKSVRQFIPEQEQNVDIIDGNSNATTTSSGPNMNPSQDVCSPSMPSSISAHKFMPQATSASAAHCDSLIRRTSCGSTPVIDSPCSVGSDGSTSWNGIPRVKRKWVDVVEVPLMMAYITRYIFGTDRIRPNSFEVRGMNGSHTGVIQSQDLAVLSHWIKLISDYITALTNIKAFPVLELKESSGPKAVITGPLHVDDLQPHTNVMSITWNPNQSLPLFQAAMLNRDFSSSEQLTYMGWVGEGVLNSNQPWQNWTPRFLALRGIHVCVFDKPPIETSDWEGPHIQRYRVYEAMFRIIKESENVDERQHCFLIQTTGGESRYFSMETRADLLRVESAWHRTVCFTIAELGSKTFHVVYKHAPAAFTIDWTDGFLLNPFTSHNYHFIYAFSQLKSSSDDGNSTLKLEFVDPPGTRGSVEQTLICPKLQDLLFYMHAFLTAKVASLDPVFLNRGRLS